nr:hypothetical protein Iba_chr04aCG11500 [Ipomoea batatas]GMD28118.1 hypothetical protein Iba_chr08eCG4320 [Ipomoea batatas]GMD65747.1 hypothetical protein Iba_chr12cCG8340 [Ipomoea batatas]GMD90034.1 hypothetical protein Iba_chr14dCG5750 [Ipomoea batatas]
MPVNTHLRPMGLENTPIFKKREGSWQHTQFVLKVNCPYICCSYGDRAANSRCQRH